MVRKSIKFAAFFILSGIIAAPLYSMDPDQGLYFSSLLDQIRAENINLWQNYDPKSPLAQALSTLEKQYAHHSQNIYQYLLPTEINPEKRTFFNLINSYVSLFKKLSNGLLACGAANGNILIIDPIKKEHLITLNAHTGQIFSIIELGNNLLLSSSYDKTINLWNINTGERISTFTTHSATVTALAKIDSDRFASASFNGEIKIWSIEHGEIKQFKIEGKKHMRPINNLVMLENGVLASGSSGGCIAFWNIETGECINTIKAHDRRINSLILLKNKMLATASADGKIKIWDPHSSKNICTIFNKNDDEVDNLIELNNGNIAARSGIFDLKIWCSITGKLLSAIPCRNFFSSIEQLDNGNIIYAEGHTKIIICNLYSQKTISWFEEALKTSPHHIAFLLQIEKYRQASKIAYINYDWFRVFNTLPIHYQQTYFKYLAISIR